MTRQEQQKLRRLEKLQRLREIAQRQAMRDTADALEQLARAQDVALRSQALSAAPQRAVDGEELHDRFRFAAALTALRADAERSVAQTSQAADDAQTALAHRSRENDLMREKLDDARRRIRADQCTESPALARSLNSSAATSPAGHRRERQAL